MSEKSAVIAPGHQVGVQLRPTEDPTVFLTPLGNAVRRSLNGSLELYPSRYVEDGQLTRWFPVVPALLIYATDPESPEMGPRQLLEPAYGSNPPSMKVIFPAPGEYAHAIQHYANILGETEAVIRQVLELERDGDHMRRLDREGDEMREIFTRNEARDKAETVEGKNESN